MAKKFHIHTDPTAPRFSPVARFSAFEAEGCLGCLQCVKRTACVYNVYQKRRFDADQVADTTDNLCVSCLRCVQECKKGILSRAPNPRFLEMGDAYWKPDLIASIMKQAETGKIPVSGAGYRGPFSGPGFDQIWTDMSEIVRPTRDGIHGREYISTTAEIGRRPQRLAFDSAGRMLTSPPPIRELPLPVILDLPDLPISLGATRDVFARAAAELDTLAVAATDELKSGLGYYRKNLLVRFNPATDSTDDLDAGMVVEIEDGPVAARTLDELSARNFIVGVRLPLDGKAAARAVELAKAGAGFIHVHADHQGRGFNGKGGEFVTSLVREVHLALVDASIRQQLTLIVSGGVAMAEHVAKTIICGADVVGLDLALLVALECRLCQSCGDGLCPVDLPEAPVEWGVKRVLNLIGAWHSQLIEVMGAMGMREVRRLRGEVGRAMFFDNLERECFAPVFGDRGGGDRTGELSSGNPGWDAAQRQGDLADREYRPLPAAPAPSRYRNQLWKFKVVRSSECIICGKCAEVCRFGVHVKAGNRMLAPRSRLCIGLEKCRAGGTACVDACPKKAVRVGPDPAWKSFGDPRWTADLLTATWVQAETGRPPTDPNLEYKKGASGGGFDRIEIVLPDKGPAAFRPEDVDLSIPLNRRGDNRPKVTIGFPVYGGGMSFGSVSEATMVSRARAWTALDSFTCTGEGGYPDALVPYNDHVITQVATGLFGVREETIQRVRIVEFKYAQGAKPGLGGHLLGDKVTPAVARMREAVVGTSLFSPFPFHSVYSVEDHKKHVDWIKSINPKTLVSVKVSTPSDVDMVAVGSFYAGAHIVHLDGSYGGTGAAPDIAKKNIAMPIEYAIPKVHRFLVAEGIRENITLIASGGLRTAWDVAKAIALGADGVVVGTVEMVALECIRCANCESGRGCPRGIATTDPELSVMYDADWGSRRLMNVFHSWAIQLQDILWRLGMKSVRELVGRSDLLVHLDYQRKAAGRG